MLIHPLGGKGTGVEAEGQCFPFVFLRDDVAGLLADAYLAHEVRDVELPLRVTRLVGFDAAFEGLPSVAGITIVDVSGRTVFDSAAATYRWKDWGARLRIHEWLTPTAVCRVVQHRAVSDPRTPFPALIVPEDGTLDERVSSIVPKRMTRLIDQMTGVAVSGIVHLVNGWNVDITQSRRSAGLRHVTAVTFGAEPSGGPGRYPGCQEPDIVVRRIGGQGPDTRGNFSLAGDGCYYVRQPTSGPATPVPATLRLGNDCGPCCDCDDYVNVQRATLRIEQRLRDTASQAEEVRDAFVAARARWLDGKACRESQLVRLSVLPHSSRFVEVFASICNATPHCLHDVTLELTLAAGAAWSVAPGTGRITDTTGKQIPYTMGGAPPVVSAYFDAIQPMTSGRVRFRAMLPRPARLGTLVTLTAEATTTDHEMRLLPQSAHVESTF
jgi:hypothetical protein